MTETITRNFVTFYSPGTFVAERTTQPIDSWDVDEAVKRAALIVERYGARPYGFRFSSRKRGPDDLDSREASSSGIYYLGGTVLTLEEVKERGDPKDRILIGNMESNGYQRVVTNDNSWTWTMPLHDDDTVLDVMLPPIPADPPAQEANQ